MSEQLLENIFVAQVLLLAKRIKADKAKNGVTTTSDCIPDALKLIREKRGSILAPGS